MKKDTRHGSLGNMMRAIAERWKIPYADLRAFLIVNFPALKDPKNCANCGASMVIDEYRPDSTDAALLIAMAKEVRHKISKGMPFTEANLVHAYTLPVSDAIRHRTTRCSYLNFIKQPEGQKNKGMYVITQWGWAALRGEPVPASVQYFRGELVGRSEEKITLGEMFRNTKNLERASDYKKGIIAEYDPNMWREFGGIAEGTLV